jgi:predicted HTH domain antitoxin
MLSFYNGNHAAHPRRCRQAAFGCRWRSVPPRLEALTLEGYRDQTLTLYQISEMLGLSRVETEDFLGRRHVPLSEINEAELDREAAVFEAGSRRTR